MTCWRDRGGMILTNQWASWKKNLWWNSGFPYLSAQFRSSLVEIFISWLQEQGAILSIGKVSQFLILGFSSDRPNIGNIKKSWLKQSVYLLIPLNLNRDSFDSQFLYNQKEKSNLNHQRWWYCSLAHRLFLLQDQNQYLVCYHLPVCPFCWTFDSNNAWMHFCACP